MQELLRRLSGASEQQELAVVFAVVAMAALVLALGGAMRWNPRLV
jgi:hypothetical protein